MSRDRGRSAIRSEGANGRTGERGSVAISPIRRFTVSRSLISVLCFLSSVLICGCEANDGNAPMAESFYLNTYKDVRSLGRVALVELDNSSDYPNIAPEMTTALFAALQKRQLFGLDMVHQSDPALQSLRQQGVSGESLKQLGEMRQALKCDGLLVGTITQYQPYPKMIVGLRLRLLDLTDGGLVWGLEQLWDSSDNSTRKRIRNWSSAATLREDLVVMSSLNFTKFVAYETAETLDQRKAAAPAAGAPAGAEWLH